MRLSVSSFWRCPAAKAPRLRVQRGSACGLPPSHRRGCHRHPRWEGGQPPPDAVHKKQLQAPPQFRKIQQPRHVYYLCGRTRARHINNGRLKHSLHSASRCHDEAPRGRLRPAARPVHDAGAERGQAGSGHRSGLLRRAGGRADGAGVEALRARSNSKDVQQAEAVVDSPWVWWGGKRGGRRRHRARINTTHRWLRRRR